MKRLDTFNNHGVLINSVIPVEKAFWFATGLFLLTMLHPPFLNARQDTTCLDRVHAGDAVLMNAPDGQILYQQNESKKYIPASTLKILTALSAIHHLGLSYRFRTEFYTDADHNLIIKGYGDPLLTSEVFNEIAGIITDNLNEFNHLILDGTHFSANINVPGVGSSTNPYDAPLGALCANFNTIFFDRDAQGQIISAEPQTPMTPFARAKIRTLNRKKGRYTFAHDACEATRYVGDLFMYFLKKKGVKCQGDIRLGRVSSKDKLIYTYQSPYTLEMVLKKMLEFSNNFVANQICIAMGIHVHGPPGTLKKGVSVISGYARQELDLSGLKIVEGSGISRQNRISAVEMMAVLRKFSPYRQILKRSGNIFFKTGTLKGINTRAGYVESQITGPCPFVIFLSNSNGDIEGLLECIENQIAQ